MTASCRLRCAKAIHATTEPLLFFMFQFLVVKHDKFVVAGF